MSMITRVLTSSCVDSSASVAVSVTVARRGLVVVELALELEVAAAGPAGQVVNVEAEPCSIN